MNIKKYSTIALVALLTAQMGGLQAGESTEATAQAAVEWGKILWPALAGGIALGGREAAPRLGKWWQEWRQQEEFSSAEDLMKGMATFIRKDRANVQNNETRVFSFKSGGQTARIVITAKGRNGGFDINWNMSGNLKGIQDKSRALQVIPNPGANKQLAIEHKPSRAHTSQGRDYWTTTF